MEDNTKAPSQIAMIFYIMDNDKKEPLQSWDIIPKKKYIIGRSKKESDIVLNEKLLSRKHAELIYYDSKTIVIKDLDSRNGTYINKERIESSKDVFFSTSDILSIGNTNNEIVFYDKTEKDKNNNESDKEKEKGKESSGEEDLNKSDKYKNNNENIRQEELINTEIKSKDKENYEKIQNKKESDRESYQRREKYEEDKNKHKEISLSNSKIHNLKIMERERNMETEIKNRRESNYDKKEMKSYERNNDYNYSNRDRRSRYLSNKSRSNSKDRVYRSRSRDTLQRSRNASKRENSQFQRLDYKNYDYYDKRDKNRERDYDDRDRDDEYMRKEITNKGERERDIYDDEYNRRKDYERQKRIEEENEEELNYRMKMKAKGQNYERYSYDDRRDGYKSEGNRIEINRDNFDNLFDKNKDDKNDDEGYVRCYVNGYMYLKIKDLEYLKGKPNRK